MPLEDFDHDGKAGGSVAAKLGDAIYVNFPKDQPIDGKVKLAALTVDVADDGSLNAQVFRPSAPGTILLTGLRTKAELDALPADDPGKNLPYWSFYRA